jgi:hypothetical protein
MRGIASHAAMAALRASLAAALHSLDGASGPASPRLHRALAATSGAIGGAFGLAALPIELPVSTILILRSIADLARQEGEDLSRPEAALACLQVFALGGRTRGDRYVDGGYFAIRGMLASSVSEAAHHLVRHGAASEGAPALVRFLAQIASRFGVTVTEKLAAQTLPIVGALGGAGVNYAFVTHFQALARGHFVVRRLERIYGAEAVRQAYENLHGVEAEAA